MDRTLTDRLRAIHLFDVYGRLLTEHQQRLAQLYYLNDLSLAEIAQRFEITRQAVFDTLRRSTAELERVEASLQMLESRRHLAHRLDALEAVVRRLAERVGRDAMAEVTQELQAVRRAAR
ncbi:MAG: YlxM family DNA-binding protein [bacterium]